MTVVCRYITVLVEMTKFEGTHYGKKIAAQMLDVTIRVKDVRPFAVRQMVRKHSGCWGGGQKVHFCPLTFHLSLTIGCLYRLINRAYFSQYAVEFPR